MFSFLLCEDGTQDKYRAGEIFAIDMKRFFYSRSPRVVEMVRCRHLTLPNFVYFERGARDATVFCENVNICIHTLADLLNRCLNCVGNHSVARSTIVSVRARFRVDNFAEFKLTPNSFTPSDLYTMHLFFSIFFLVECRRMQTDAFEFRCINWRVVIIKTK